MIKSFSVYGLFNKFDHEIALHPDLNILTGRNGSGKTTLLKLMWYMISPNVERTVPEILFHEAFVETDDFTLTIKQDMSNKHENFNLSYKEISENKFDAADSAPALFEGTFKDKVDEVNHKIDDLNTKSVFFPTFRRIEGGFSIDERRHQIFRETPSVRASQDLSRSLSRYSSIMSVHGHKFITTISTDDIEQLVTHQYADLSEQANNLHLELSRFIAEKVSPKKNTKLNSDKLISEIREKLVDVNKRRDNLMSPFSVLTNLIVEIFKDKGIIFSQNLTFGETKKAIRASILSAGEKQMLSFLCYNTFMESSPIFIDEPELSLHGDWQRRLFPTLLAQGTSNQFIVSTHSPFIYSKFPEKEIRLDPDTGE